VAWPPSISPSNTEAVLYGLTANTDAAVDGAAVDGENCEVAALDNVFWSNICGLDSSASFRRARSHVVRHIAMDIILSTLKWK